MEVSGMSRPTLLFYHSLVVRVGCQQIVSTVNGVTTTTVIRLEFGHCRVITIGENVVVLQVVGELDSAVIVFMIADRWTAFTLKPRHMSIYDDPRCFLVAFLLLHPPVLEPYLYLSLSETQLSRHLLPLVPHDVPGSLEHSLQHGRLVFGIRLPRPFTGT
jgi:hypothetical protein